MQTNLTLNFSYATDYFDMAVKGQAHLDGRRARLSALSHPEVLAVEKKAQTSDPIFNLQAWERADENRSPLSETSCYWLQIPPSNEFQKMTQYSGKFLIQVDLERVDALWRSFCEAHLTNKSLGYGLRCSTAKTQEKTRILAIHIVNCFDLENVAHVAFHIKQLLGDWKGVMKVVTDLSTELALLDSNHPLSQLTYEVHDYVFRHYNGNTKEENVFIHHFKLNEFYNCRRKKSEFDKYLMEQNKVSVDGTTSHV